MILLSLLSQLLLIFCKKKLEFSPLQMNLETENEDDVNEIRMLRPESKGYEKANKMHEYFEAHCDSIETLKQSLRYK